MTDEIECSICKSISKPFPVTFDGSKLECPRCGVYSITGTAEVMWKANNPGPRQVANASSWICEHQGINILDSNIIEFLLSLTTPSVNTRAIRILTALEKMASSISEYQSIYVYALSNFGNIPNKDDALQNQLRWLGISYSVNLDELRYLLSDYLDTETNFLTTSDQTTHLRVQITPKGHTFIADIKKTQVDSQTGFCAMWFDENLLPIWTSAIEPGIRNAGYDPKRIDSHQHNNKIDDEIISMIRSSKFVVADFTGQRGGVYFEAGFALGLNLPVIWTCKKSDLENVHFDNRQYNFILWERDKLHEFKANLQNRIEATLGRGSLN